MKKFILLFLFILANCAKPFNFKYKTKMFVQYETENLILKSTTIEDEKHYIDMLNDPENVKLIWTGEPWGEAKVKKIHENYVKRWSDDNPLSALTILRKEDKKFIGYVLLGTGPLKEYANSLELIICINKNFWNKKYATQVGPLLVKFFKEKIKGKEMISPSGIKFTPESIYASARKENLASNKLLQNNGFKQVGTELKHDAERNIYLLKLKEDK